MNGNAVIARWENVRAKWGRDLLDEFPKGLGTEPDFSNGLFRDLWLFKGWNQYIAESSALGRFPTVVVGTKDDYGQFEQLSPSARLEIAKYAFNDAKYLWGKAKQEADEAAAEEQRKLQLVLQHETELNQLRTRVHLLTSMTELQIEQKKFLDLVEQAGSRADPKAQSENEQKLFIVQARMIDLEMSKEREASFVGWGGLWLGLGGLLVGLFFGGFSVWVWLHP
jgi:hypothetical protein